jgi:hypothetical protein
MGKDREQELYQELDALAFIPDWQNKKQKKYFVVLHESRGKCYVDACYTRQFAKPNTEYFFNTVESANKALPLFESLAKINKYKGTIIGA